MIDEGGWSPDTELAGAVGTKIDIDAVPQCRGEPARISSTSSTRACSAAACRSGLRDEIYKAVAALPASEPRRARARPALFLALTSFQFQVMR